MTFTDPGNAVRDATLRQRARQLAQPQATTEARNGIEIIVLQLASESYAIETKFVREVYPLKDLTPIPCTPPFVVGIINLRGELCPLIDLKVLLDLPHQGLTNATRAVVIHDAAMEFGIVADAIIGVRWLDTEEILPLPSVLSRTEGGFLTGMTANRTMILDAATILAHPGIVVNDHVGDR